MSRSLREEIQRQHKVMDNKKPVISKEIKYATDLKGLKQNVESIIAKGNYSNEDTMNCLHRLINIALGLEPADGKR